MIMLNVAIAIVVLLLVWRLSIARGRKLGYNECLEVNRDAFISEVARKEKQQKLIRKAYQVGKLEGSMSVESNRQRNN